MDDLTLIIVDSDLAFDHKVKSSIPKYSASCVVDWRAIPVEYNRIAVYCNAVYLFSKVLFCLPYYYRKATKVFAHDELFAMPILAGFSAFIRSCLVSIKHGCHIVEAQKLNSVLNIHSHDLYASLVPLYINNIQIKYWIYDSHEFQVHRNRKTGLLRILAEMYLEAQIIKCCNEVILPNYAVIEVIKKMYPHHSSNYHKYRVVYNNYYTKHEVKNSDATKPAIVYVGMGIQGRQLDKLEYKNLTDDLRKHSYFMFFLGEVPKNLKDQNHWIIGPQYYEQSLLEKVEEYRCVMWCCLDSQSLSYRLAIPNKFFQGLAVGMPIVASEGTYLAQIVTKYEIGFILVGNELDKLFNDIESVEYKRCKGNILKFRDLLLNDQVFI